MKKVLLFCLMLSLLFCSCRREEKDIPPSEICGSVAEALGKENYLLGEVDYIENEFGDLAEQTELCVIYRDGENLSECGVFRVNENLSANDLKMALEEYLANRTETTKALADLYPAQTLAANLSYLQNADIIVGKHCVYYLVMPESEKKQAKKAVNEALSN